MENYNIFFVNRGHSLLLPLNLHKTTVNKLHSIISNEVNVRSNEQILLGAKGVTLDGSKTLASYQGIGTKSSPLFLFQKANQERDDGGIQSDVNYIFHMIDDIIEQTNYVFSCDDNTKIYVELPEKIKECLNIATTVLHTCAKLVEEHQFLYQGWMALISNLEDSVSKLQKRATKFEKLIEKMVDINVKAETLLVDFGDVLNQLKMIEVPYEVLLKPQALGVQQAVQVGSGEKISLYEWISRADPSSSLEEIAEEVKIQMKRFTDHNPKNVFTAINIVIEQARNAEYRDIKGINKRFSQLDYSLVTSEENFKRIESVAKKITETPKTMDTKKLDNLIKDDRKFFADICDCFDKLKNTIRVFDQSKQELLQNVRTRLAGFIVQSYDKLNYAHMEMLTYEEKSKFIRLRLDLIEQIKDSPVLFSQTVSEVVRRILFRNELKHWHGDHSEKCTNITNEELSMRKRISKKLHKHFLRSLFPGMFDEIPEFFVKAPLPNFDDELPNIEKEYISSLRRSVPDLEKYLKVKVPEICLKLTNRESKPNPPLGMSKREDSFMTKEPMNMAQSNFYCSPAGWLSEDGEEPSPVPPSILMGNSRDNIMRESQIKTIPIVPSLQQLDGLSSSAPGTSIAKSAPIEIPKQKFAARSVPREGLQYSSDESCKFSNTDIKNQNNQDSVEEQQFPLEDVTNSSNFDETLKPMKTELAAIAKGLLDVRAEILNNSDKFADEFGQVNNFLSVTIPKKVEEIENDHKEELKKLMDTITELMSKIQESERSVSERNTEIEQLTKQKHEELNEKEMKAIRLEEKVALLEAEVKSVETEIFKKLTIEYELMNDRTRSDHEEQILSKDEEIEELKKEIDKKNAELLKEQYTDPYTEEFKKHMTAEIRAELEKEFKARTELITLAVEQKKDENIARIRKEFEVENKILSRENESKARKLQVLANERDKLREIIEKGLSDGFQVLKELDDSLGSRVTNVPSMPNLPLCRSSYPLGASVDMEESVFENTKMMASTAVLTSVLSEGDIEVESCQTTDHTNTVSTQTKLCQAALSMMVTIQDIKPGCTVLVIWDERHSSYILFCASQYRHFVKETSVRKLGLAQAADGTTATRRNWILGRAVKLDNCAIKKAVNRYKLSIGTVVRRVEVEPVMWDMDSDTPSSSINA